MHGRKLEDLESQIESVNRSYKKCYHEHMQNVKSIPGERERAKAHVVLEANVICTTLNSCRS